MAASFRTHIQILSLTLLFTVIFTVQPVVSVDPPEYSPSPSPQLPADDLSPSPVSPSISPSVQDSSPPAPPPSDSSPAPSPAPENSSPDKSPSPPSAPAPEIASDVNHANKANFGNLESSGGMKNGHKAGIALGVVAFACVFGIGAIVYKKRQQNIRRSQYGYDARREFL
ncbi:classical arabinogalactan protein 1-like [Abeliophyllum distichum]|uniref:Classical arabinogalactan protein 1-like n=1 Tax=Abeliophyllum distichum TaxID=126358 RepID=A0ABD1Q4W3_9LAMI